MLSPPRPKSVRRASHMGIGTASSKRRIHMDPSSEGRGNRIVGDRRYLRSVPSGSASRRFAQEFWNVRPQNPRDVFDRPQGRVRPSGFDQPHGRLISPDRLGQIGLTEPEVLTEATDVPGEDLGGRRWARRKPLPERRVRRRGDFARCHRRSSSRNGGTVRVPVDREQAGPSGPLAALMVNRLSGLIHGSEAGQVRGRSAGPVRNPDRSEVGRRALSQNRRRLNGAISRCFPIVPADAARPRRSDQDLPDRRLRAVGVRIHLPQHASHVIGNATAVVIHAALVEDRPSFLFFLFAHGAAYRCLAFNAGLRSVIPSIL
jgi:hypothetical protein